jgi:hypothetical protein
MIHGCAREQHNYKKNIHIPYHNLRQRLAPVTAPRATYREKVMPD